VGVVVVVFFFFFFFFFTSVLHHVQADSSVRPVPCGIDALVFPPGVKQMGREAVTHFHQVPRLRLSGPMLPVVHFF